jgi:hypothetical protein
LVVISAATSLDLSGTEGISLTEPRCHGWKVSLEKRPEKVIYGKYSLHDSFCIFEEADHLETYSAEVVAIQQCTTTDQLAQLIPTLTVASPPVDLEDLEEGYEVDSPWDWRETDAVADGDWPPMPTANALYIFPHDDPIRDDLRDSVGCEVITTVLNGDYLRIPLDKEPELLAAFAKYGIEARRDDRLIEPFAME